MKHELYSIWTIQETLLQTYRAIFTTMQSILLAGFASFGLAGFASFGGSLGAGLVALIGVVTSLCWIKIGSDRQTAVDIAQALLLMDENNKLAEHKGRSFQLFKHCQKELALPDWILIEGSRALKCQSEYQEITKKIGFVRKFMNVLPYGAIAVWLILLLGWIYSNRSIACKFIGCCGS